MDIYCDSLLGENMLCRMTIYVYLLSNSAFWRQIIRERETKTNNLNSIKNRLRENNIYNIEKREKKENTSKQTEGQTDIYSLRVRVLIVQIDK